MALVGALVAAAIPARAEDPVYEFGVLPQVATAKVAEQWVPFLDRLSEMSGVKLKFVTAPSISEFGTRAAAGEYAFYYHNTLAYVQAEPLYQAFAREVGAKTVGVLVVAKTSKARGLKDLKGGTISIPSAGSFGAAVLPLYAIQNEAGLDLQKDVKVVISGSHEAGYQAVLQGKADAAGGLTRTFQLMPEEARAQLRILYTTKEYSPLPFAARKDVPPEVVARVQKALVEFAKNPANAPILEALNMKKGFEAAKPADWQDVRKAREGLVRVTKAVTPPK
ncbi:MAG TPA: phosphate/phosphite/phosphonate ABC transporter substrate-binding protein [Anaeromyxobacteraceae bacterium]|nr:phosphate/phosphite/phosphonate ABC transporter substrate-binding protein [Anaeromyxobacteraceae bacterium]